MSVQKEPEKALFFLDHPIVRSAIGVVIVGMFSFIINLEQKNSERQDEGFKLLTAEVKEARKDIALSHEEIAVLRMRIDNLEKEEGYCKASKEIEEQENRRKISEMVFFPMDLPKRVELYAHLIKNQQNDI